MKMTSCVSMSHCALLLHLHQLIKKLVILGDFNARVEKDYETWSPLGCYGIGTMNANGLKLLELCSEFNLAICNTFFAVN